MKDSKILSNTASEITGYAQLEDRRIWFHLLCSNYRRYVQLTIEMVYTSFMLPERSVLAQLWYFNACRDNMIFLCFHRDAFYVSSYASKSWIVPIILRLSQKSIFHYVNPFNMNLLILILDFWKPLKYQ